VLKKIIKMIQVICRDDEKSQNLIYVKNTYLCEKSNNIAPRRQNYKNTRKINLCEKHLFMLKQIKSDAHG
jgi:hypothetical protein